MLYTETFTKTLIQILSETFISLKMWFQPCHRRVIFSVVRYQFRELGGLLHCLNLPLSPSFYLHLFPRPPFPPRSMCCIFSFILLRLWTCPWLHTCIFRTHTLFKMKMMKTPKEREKETESRNLKKKKWTTTTNTLSLYSVTLLFPTFSLPYASA